MRSPTAATADPTLSVVIPTLNEAKTLPLLVGDLARLALPPHEVVVVDGGSEDGTPEVAHALGLQVHHVPPAERGRARQMNAGAAASRGGYLCFLHADTRIPPETGRALVRWLEAPTPEQAAHFAFALDARGARWRLIEAGQRLRERTTGLVYGDQGLVVSRARFEAVGGFPPVALMEDVGIVRALQRTGGLHRLDAPLRTSVRRYRDEGTFRGVLRNLMLLALYQVGASPSFLARFYPPSPPAPPPRTLLAFVKLPLPGQVKTRLARDIGPESAARIYADMAAAQVAAWAASAVQAESGASAGSATWSLEVHVAPPFTETEVRAWLPHPTLTVRAQEGGDLGERMFRALAATDPRGAACLVGTDAPAVTAAYVEAAFQALTDGGLTDQAPEGAPTRGAAGSESAHRPHLVLGPAVDGGYALIGVGPGDRAQLAPLFRGIPWSTDEVLARTRSAAEMAGLTVHLLTPVRDIDTLQDLKGEAPEIAARYLAP